MLLTFAILFVFRTASSAAASLAACSNPPLGCWTCLTWITLPSNKDGPLCKAPPNSKLNTKNQECKETMDFSDPKYLGEAGMIYKKNWAEECNVDWSGVDNRVQTGKNV